MKEKESHRLIRAVIYARYSSSGQREESIEGQIRECKAYAKRNGFTIVGEYTDKALTGRTDRRPDFQRMLRDAERGAFEAVLCWKMDRFARNRYDSATYKYRLKKCGVRLYYAMEQIPDGPEGIILESVMEGYAEYYSENLSQNVKRGNYESAKELKTLGLQLLGLRKGADGRFEIDPATAPAVRRIFEQYAAGIPAKDIYTQLNNEGYRTSRGGRFNKNSIRRIIQNERYAGVYLFKDMRVEGGIPAIVTHELWEKCQKVAERHHVSPAADRDVTYLLTTKLFCGHCGEAMTGESARSRGTTYYYYICNGRRKRKCKKKRAPKEWIEDVIVRELAALIQSDEFCEEVADRCVEYQQRTRDMSDLQALEKRQRENEKAIKNVLAAIDAGIITESVKSHLVELEAERADLERGIAQLLIDEPDISKEQVLYFFDCFKNGSTDDPEWRQLLVDMFLNAAYLYDDDKITLVLNYTQDGERVTLELAEEATSGDGVTVSCFAPSGPPDGANTKRTVQRVLHFVGKAVAVVVRLR